MIGKTGLGETDLHLYLAGALPPSKRFLMVWALLMDRDLRESLRALRDRNGSYRKGEMRRLRGILFPALPAVPGALPARPASGGKAAGSGPARRLAEWLDRAPDWMAGGNRFPALAAACAMAILCVVPLRNLRDLRASSGVEGGAGATFDGEAFGQVESKGDDGQDFIAKGRGLGVNLFVKGDTAYRVEHQSALVSVTDTLQVMPMGSEAQHLVLLGWDEHQGLVRLFPKAGDRARKVSRQDPPPALLLQDMADNRLICVTAVGPFRIADAEAALRRKPFLPMEKAPPSHLEKGLYLQVFSITKGGGRI
ncbi:MAG: hypothetical protein JWP91_658 [Fibrobacteres bacterium]|nr:hypothetical protein [Fibrobacterota bacterium]